MRTSVCVPRLINIYLRRASITSLIESAINCRVGCDDDIAAERFR
jgi:hypothetical protein